MQVNASALMERSDLVVVVPLPACRSVAGDRTVCLIILVGGRGGATFWRSNAGFLAFPRARRCLRSIGMEHRHRQATNEFTTWRSTRGAPTPERKGIKILCARAAVARPYSTGHAHDACPLAPPVHHTDGDNLVRSVAFPSVAPLVPPR